MKYASSETKLEVHSNQHLFVRDSVALVCSESVLRRVVPIIGLGRPWGVLT